MLFMLLAGCLGKDANLPTPGDLEDTGEATVDTDDSGGDTDEWIDTGSADGPKSPVTMHVMMDFGTGPENIGAVPVSAFSHEGAELIAYGVSESPFEVPSQPVRIFAGNPMVSGEISPDLITEDGYVVLEMNDEEFISDPVETTLVDGEAFEESIALSLLIGHKYYDTTVTAWELNDGDPHDPEYSRGDEWMMECDLWSTWIYQDAGHLLLPEEDPDGFVRGNWCFLQPGETLEVHGSELVLMGATTNFLQSVRESHDDFRFVYVDITNDLWWEVEGKAW